VARFHLTGDPCQVAAIKATPEVSGIGHSSFGPAAERHRTSTNVVDEPSNTSEDHMGDHRTIRAWKDAEFRASLGDDEAAGLAPSPVGTIELDDADMGDASGGAIALPFSQTSICTTSMPCAGAIIVTISNQMSCGACDTTVWHGTCAASSIGCC
jgi:mersacidin/lichenicidin family type 2 lantibiotic